MSPLSLPEELRAMTLLDFFSNPLFLYHSIPYLPVSSVLSLATTSKAFRNLIFETPSVFRYLDLSRVKAAKFNIAAIDNGGQTWRNVQLDENVTEDDFYGGPLRGVFESLSRRNVLQDVQTLILDGLSVPSELVSEIILDRKFNVRLLSLREVQYLNERKLMQALEYAVRSTRAEGTPKLQGLYIFGSRDPAPAPRRPQQVEGWPAGVAPIDAAGAQIGAQWNEKSLDALVDSLTINETDNWYQNTGKILPRAPAAPWADTMERCRGIIRFDAVICSGPRHQHHTELASKKKLWYQQEDAYLPPAVASIALKGCAVCGKAPEGFAHYGSDPADRFPLLAPLPLHSSSAKAASRPLGPSNIQKRLLVRCQECLRNRYCQTCHKFWCEDCYRVPENYQPQNALDWHRKSDIPKELKVLMGLCVQNCVLEEMLENGGNIEPFEMLG